jgi:hypothetical protein
MKKAVDLLLAEEDLQTHRFLPQQRRRVEEVWGLGFAEAQELLDVLERLGCSGVEVSLQEDGLFGVRCTCPVGLQLQRSPGGRVQLIPVS